MWSEMGRSGLVVAAFGLLVACRCPGSGEVVEAAPAEVTAGAPEAVEPLLRAPGLLVDRVPWAWEGQVGWAWRARLPRDAVMKVLPSADVVDLVDLVPPSPPPWAVLNGGFYDDGPMGLVRAGGVEHAPLTKGGGSGVLFDDGTGARVVHRDQWQGQGAEAVQSIDRLVFEGRSVVGAGADAAGAARSAVAISKEAVWLVILVHEDSAVDPEARPVEITDPYGRGMSLAAFADWLITELGAEQALNMDGGLSTNLLVRGGAEEVFEVRGVSGTINGVWFRPR
jgi:hypothetical protein